MTVREMSEKISEIEKDKKVSIYFKYDHYCQQYFFKMYKKDTMLEKSVPVAEIITWSIDILEEHLCNMADKLNSFYSREAKR